MHIAIAGNIGSGKTTLAGLLAKHYGWTPHYEDVDDNPYLNDFYEDMLRWSFNLQIYFLNSRFSQIIEIKKSDKTIVQDRTIYEDAYIFSRALHQMGNLSDRDYLAYRRVFEMIVKQLPPPDLLIYLKAPVEVLVERIHRRARDIETGISKDYLTLLDSFYEDWMQTFDNCPVLTIRTDDLDFVHQSQHLETVVARIQDKLAGKETVVLRA